MESNRANLTFTTATFKLTIAFSLLLLSPVAVAAWQSTAPASRGTMMKEYCVGCHNNKVPTAGVTLESIDPAKVGPDAGTWERILRKLSANQMPPAGAPKPSDSERKAFTAWLESELDRGAAANPNPGRTTVHRLNRNEYSNTIRDLLALDTKPGASLPVDDTGYGFDNVADVLSLSPVLMEKYMATARNIARLAVGDVEMAPVVDTFDGLAEVRSASRATSRLARNDKVSEDLPFDSVGGLSLKYMFPVDAEYMFRVKLASSSGAFGETAPPVGQILELQVPVSAGIHHLGVTFQRSDAVAETVAVFGGGRGGGRGGGGAAATVHLDLRLDGARLKLYDVPEAPRGREIHSVDIAGPYKVTGAGDSPSRRKIFVCRPGTPSEESPCAKKILSSLARSAYRRTVTEADLQPLMSFYRRGRSAGSFDRGIESALRLMLVSPDFLFRAERDPAGATAGSIHRLSDFELASRLSFFLWSSIPDEALLDLAEKNRLRDPVSLKQQVARMLEDPKSKALVSNFSGQWLLLRNLSQIKPDPDAFPEFDTSLREAFGRETEMFFQAIVREDKPVTELLTANFTFLNQRLADFYGIRGVYGSAFRRVELTDSKRGGILGQGSILTVTSYPNRTSVVQRGKWVLENLLGTPPPAPPANVPPLELHDKDRKLSVREAMELHRANPVCASCHSRMDPIGFSLENYSGIGGWRDTENGVSIDASGKLPDGTEFRGPGGLTKILLNGHRDEFVTTFTEKLLTYALGRGLEQNDMPAVRAIVRDAATENLTVRALVRAIVRSSQFQMRRTRES